jgi:hypothetical protein
VTGDAYKTLFVARVAFDTSERRLKREFEEYGPVKKVTLVKNKDGKSRGYAFIEFEKEKDMRSTSTYHAAAERCFFFVNLASLLSLSLSLQTPTSWPMARRWMGVECWWMWSVVAP